MKSSGLLAMPDSQLPDPPADSVPESGAEDSDDRIGHVKPQVLIVDLGMPEMDGFEFIKVCGLPRIPAFRTSRPRH